MLRNYIHPSSQNQAIAGCRGWAVLVLFGLLPSACAVVGPGERGVKRTLGELDTTLQVPGTVWHNPFVTSVPRVSVRSENVEVELSLPSKEGLTVLAEISVVYRVRPDAVIQILETVGADYERVLVLTSFRSMAAHISAKHFAKDMHSTMRANIEDEILEGMNKRLRPRGFEVETVLLKSIVLPARLVEAIEAKLQAEQRSQQMAFTLEQERQEAERRRVEAEGIRDAQKILAEGLTPEILRRQAIEAFRELAKSPNAKTIVTDGRAMLLPPAISP